MRMYRTHILYYTRLAFAGRDTDGNALARIHVIVTGVMRFCAGIPCDRITAQFTLLGRLAQTCAHSTTSTHMQKLCRTRLFALIM